MTKTQIAKKESYLRVTDTVDNYPLITAGVIGLKDEMTDLATSIVKIDKASVAQIAESLGITTSEAMKLKMATTIMKYTLRAKVQAKRLGLTTIVNQLDEPISNYMKASKIDSINLVKAARNVLDAKKEVLVVITEAIITEIDGTVSDFENVKDEPLEAKIITKAAGTDLLPPLFLAADSTIQNILDLVESYIGITQPAFTNELKLTAELQV